jgi:hypothetical protein
LLELDIHAIDAGIAHMRNLLDDSEDGKYYGGKELATTHHSRPR